MGVGVGSGVWVSSGWALGGTDASGNSDGWGELSPPPSSGAVPGESDGAGDSEAPGVVVSPGTAGAVSSGPVGSVSSGVCVDSGTVLGLLCPGRRR